MTATRCLICNCEKTMPLDESKLSKALDRPIGPIFTNLCRSQLDHFETALKTDESLLVACTQESPLFLEIAEEHQRNGELRFVNIRENAGWSKEADKAAAKIAALLNDADFDVAPARLKSIQSNGMCLVYGSGQQAFEVAKLLSSRLSVTLLLSDTDDFVLPSTIDIPIYRGDVVKASGSFGEFSVTVDHYAPLLPSSRGTLDFAMARNGAKSNCSLIFDLSGKTPLFTGAHHRDGYTHPDPGDPATVMREVIRFLDWVGEFEKPIYVKYRAETCAHSRSQKTGCNKCLDVCPAGAITNAGDIIEIDANICGGCGSCHAVCPTGSISYQYPTRSDTLARVQNLLSTYDAAGGRDATLLLHDETFGLEMISVLSRFSDGLPANVLPLGLHAVSSIGHVEMLGILASDAARVLLLADPKREDEFSAMVNEAQLASEILSGLGFAAEGRIEVILETDPDRVAEVLWSKYKSASSKIERFNAVGSKREVARILFSRLHSVSRSKPDRISLSPNAPYGSVEIDQSACTLCMACTSACPANALTDTPGEPKLRFTQSACVQCGLCVNTCPENALSLLPQLDFTSAAMQPQTLYEEEPFECISCGTPFATKSTIERIAGQLAGKHSMFVDDERSNLIKMCDNCRIEAQANSTNDPFIAGIRPKPRTTEDYLSAEKADLSVDDFLIGD